MSEWPLRSSSLRARTAVAVADPVLRGNVAGAVERFTANKRLLTASTNSPRMSSVTGSDWMFRENPTSPLAELASWNAKIFFVLESKA